MTVTGDLKHSRVRFGTDASALTAEQVRAFRHQNHRVFLDDAGYLHPIPPSTILVIR